jgi:hypothetical protein
VPPAKRSKIGATFTMIAKPALQCIFEPLSQAHFLKLWVDAPAGMKARRRLLLSGCLLAA